MLLVFLLSGLLVGFISSLRALCCVLVPLLALVLVYISSCILCNLCAFPGCFCGSGYPVCGFRFSFANCVPLLFITNPLYLASNGFRVY